MSSGRFLIRRQDQSVNDVSIDSDGLTIGRAPGNDLVLNHRAVDETHAGIKEIDGRYWIFNLSSSNGIVVNGSLVEETEVRNGDGLKAGPYLLRFALAQQTLNITVEVGAGLQLEDVARDGAQIDAGPELSMSQAKALEVFWDKRKRESGKII